MNVDAYPIGQAAVIGDGAMGTVCAMLLAGHGAKVRLWGRRSDHVATLQRDRENRRYLPGHRFPDSLHPTAEASTALADCELIVSAVPCQFIRPVWNRLSAYYRPATPVVSVTKGIEDETLLRPSQVLAALLGDVTAAVLSGPSIAPEIAKGHPATVVVASDDIAISELVQRAFSTHWFRVYTNADPLGTEIAGATKNVIALAAGMIDGLGLGDNCKAALLTRGLVEITRLGVAMGAHAETFKGLAGVGDLVTTCISPLGRNRSAGEKIGQGVAIQDVVRSMPGVIEGIATTRGVVRLAHEFHVQMPITAAVHAVLFEHLDPRQAIDDLMTRQLKPE